MQLINYHVIELLSELTDFSWYRWYSQIFANQMPNIYILSSRWTLQTAGFFLCWWQHFMNILWLNVYWTHTHIVLTVLWAAKNTKYPINIILVVESMSFSLILSLADQWKSWNTFDLPWDSLHRYISILCMIIDFDITNCYNEYFHHWTFNWQTLRCYRLNNLTKFVLLRFWV